MRISLGLIAAALAMTACSTAVDASSTDVTVVSADTSVAASSGLERLLLTATDEAPATATPLPLPEQQLPRGGRRIFPTYLVVAHYGTAKIMRPGPVRGRRRNKGET